MCRKIALAKIGDDIEIWGDGEQTRSFLYIDECMEGTRGLTRSDFAGPVNIGSEEMVTHQSARRPRRRHRRQASREAAIPGRWACAGAIPTTD